MFEFLWQAYENPSCGDHWQSIDLVFEVKSRTCSNPRPDSFDDIDVSSLGFSSPIISQFFVECLRAAQASPECGFRVAKLIVPLTEGQIARADIIPLRFQDCEFVETSFALAKPLQTYPGKAVRIGHISHLSRLFEASVGGLIIQKTPDHLRGVEVRSLSLFVEAELQNRLSFPWIVKHDRSQTLVIVEGGRVHPDNGGTGPNIYLAGIALGIKIVVLDNAGHWLEGPEFEHWREGFITTEMHQPPDQGFTDRIVQSVSSYGRKVDGIITFCDSYQVPVARAAQILGLSTAGPDPYEIATDKYKTSIFEGRKAHLVSSAQDALKIAVTHGDSMYPAIIKPCNGWSSEGVFRVDHISGLLASLQSLQAYDTSRHGKDFVIERYCSGPEVDANFVLLDGEILFFEVCDDFPKSADINGHSSGSVPTFIELDSVFPSALPSSEIGLLRLSFHNTLLRLGLRNGIMHLEGRMDHSMVDYQTKNGVVDLQAREVKHNVVAIPAPWLVEINPRPPGMKGTQIIESTYGVDYWGLALLIALGNKLRARALSCSFTKGAQYTCVMVFIPADYDVLVCEGIFDSDDICDELLSRRPDLAKQISRCGCLVKRGERIPHPSIGVNSFIAYFNVYSRRGRHEALQLAKMVREEVKFSFR